MDIRKIKKLIELIEESDIAEIKITEGEESVCISRYTTQMQPIQYSQQLQPQQFQHLTQSQLSCVQTTNNPQNINVEELQLEGKIIRSPMVGTFYAAPSPDSDAFVSVGSNVKIGDTVCIIEAMKMFNRIDSDFDGQIAEILVDNGQPVEYDEPLFIVK